MHPVHSDLSNSLRYEQLLAEANHQRLMARAGPPPRVQWRERVSAARRAVGYRLVEAGLHLVNDGQPVPRLR
jgi:hypothetical protein